MSHVFQAGHAGSIPVTRSTGKQPLTCVDAGQGLSHAWTDCVLPTLGDTPLKALTPARVREWHAGLSNTTGPTAQAQAYRLMRTICSQAVQDGEIPANHCQIRGAANPRTPERPIPTLAQVHALADLVPDRYRVMVLVAAHGGLRFGELTALTQADLHLEDPNLPAVTVLRARCCSAARA